ncbi:MAG: hypothetical protein E7647_06250 [Ruminococcaceae bacterium]|nr:hypothetical protein [Oscillospiraceae bacterium]
MESINLQEVWVWALGILSGLLVIANFIEKVTRAVSVAKAPNERQDERLSIVEKRLEVVERKLANDDERFKDIRRGDHATQRALLALLDHGIDGNNIDQMKNAKEELNNYLIEK